jgi:hypothetical protein
LTGFREADRGLLTGMWPPGELLAVALPDPPALARPHTVEDTEPLYVVRNLAFVRFADLDRVHRRARVEVGLAPGAESHAAEVLVLAVAHGFAGLGLHRLHGWVTRAAGAPTDAVRAAGFVLEATVPRGRWHAGGPVDRETWGCVDD